MLRSVAILVLLVSIYCFYSPFNFNRMRTPVYFLSHGGPTFLYRDAKFGSDSGAFDVTSLIGKHVREIIQPKFIIAVSAHWQSGSSSAVEVAVPQNSNENELIYDFHGFPKHMYAEKFRTWNDLSLASRITRDIDSYFSNDSSSSLQASLTPRGIDHGVWVPLKVAFPSESKNGWNLNCPLVQVSLTADEEDFDTHYKLGQALSKYRDEGGLILVSGMSVHNLRDLAVGEPLDYTVQFNRLLRDILLTDNSSNDKLAQLKNLLKDPAKRKLLFSAHPTLEHFVPIIVGLGAGAGRSDDRINVKELYNNELGSLGWGIYQFGDSFR